MTLEISTAVTATVTTAALHVLNFRIHSSPFTSRWQSPLALTAIFLSHPCISHSRLHLGIHLIHHLSLYCTLSTFSTLQLYPILLNSLSTYRSQSSHCHPISPPTRGRSASQSDRPARSKDSVRCMGQAQLTDPEHIQPDCLVRCWDVKRSLA